MNNLQVHARVSLLNFFGVLRIMKWITSLSLSALLSFSTFASAEKCADKCAVPIQNEDICCPDECLQQQCISAQEEQEVCNLLEYSQDALKKVKVEKQNCEVCPVKPTHKATHEKTEILFTSGIDKIGTDPENTESLAIQVDKEMQEEESIAPSPAPRTVKEKSNSIEISLRQVFGGAPIIYSLLLILSIASFGIWFYSMLTIRNEELFPEQLLKDMRAGLMSNQFGEVIHLCQKERFFFCKMIETGILARKQGLGVMMEMMKAEGKRCTVGFWQRLNLLNDIALIAPMLGLLGTVMGMFYAFYDLHRSAESINILFDGLGISVGTTVAGLVVAIISMILHSVAKYRLVRVLTSLENEAQHFAALLETKGPSYLET